MSPSQPSTEALLQEALALHQRGEFEAAADLYEQILTRIPQHADGLHLLGLTRLQAGDAIRAAALIRRAIAADGRQAVFHFNLANVLRELHDPAAAARAYQAAIELQPQEADFHNNLGIVLEELDRPEEAAACYRQALALQPGDPEFHYNLGNVLRALGQPQEAAARYAQALALAQDFVPAHRALAELYLDQERAEAALVHYQQAIALAPHDARLHVDRGACLQRLGRLPEAAAAYRQALTLAPALAQAHNNLGALLQEQGLLEEAAECYRAALRHQPEFPEAHNNYASVLEAQGDVQSAVAHYEAAVRQRPDYAVAAFKLAALRGEDVPQAPAAYVAELFDHYAEQFDSHLTGVLGYHTPERLRALLEQFGTGRGLQVLDLGCGTGLSGEAFRDVAATLSGVDLSPKMIDKARARDIYDTLQVGDIVQALRGSERWDLIVAADVFVYLGDLAPVLAAARRALRPGGLLLFSVERGEEAGFALRQAGRYAHGPRYVRERAHSEGFVLRREEPAVLRKEFGTDVQGLLYALQAPASP